MRPTEKEKSKQKRPEGPGLFSILKPYSAMVAFMVILAILSSGVNLVIPKIISHGIDAFKEGAFSFRKVMIEFLIAAFVIFVFTYLQSIVQTYASERVARDLRNKISGKISQQSYSFIIRSNPSRLLTNLTSDVDSIKMFVSLAVVTIVSSIFMIIGTCVLLLLTNWKLALPILLIIPIIGGTFFFVLSKVRVLFKKSREIIDWLNKVINESIIGAALIRVINAQQPEYHKFLETNTKARDLGLSILRLFAALIPIINFVASMATLVILGLGGHLVITGRMSLGELTAFNSYLSMLIFPILMIGFMSNIIAQATASYGRIGNVLNAPVLEESGEVSEILKGDIEMENVSLSYEDKPVLKNISFQIPGKSRTAIIGPTAAGKTQLVYLLANLIKPTDGKIHFDHRDIDAYQRTSFYGQVGLVFQDSVIFNMSLRENIAFSEEVSDQALQKAIETAELNDFLASLPDGLDTVVSERGTSLSGGQKQRIMLARALAINPRVLLLDDFTARVDRKTERKILCNLENNYPELTLITITQKISSVKHFEQIILLMEGEIIASGTHKALQESCPEYIQIYNSQKSTSHYEL